MHLLSLPTWDRLKLTMWQKIFMLEWQSLLTRSHQGEKVSFRVYTEFWHQEVKEKLQSQSNKWRFVFLQLNKRIGPVLYSSVIFADSNNIPPSIPFYVTCRNTIKGPVKVLFCRRLFVGLHPHFQCSGGGLHLEWNVCITVLKSGVH